MSGFSVGGSSLVLVVGCRMLVVGVSTFVHFFIDGGLVGIRLLAHNVDSPHPAPKTREID